jgi:hypothetical protein
MDNYWDSHVGMFVRTNPECSGDEGTNDMTCAFLDTAFEAAASGIGIGGFGSTTTTLLIALTTNGYPNYDPANPSSGPGAIGQGWGMLQYTPGQWVQVEFGGIPRSYYVPPQFSGSISYAFSQIEEGFSGGQNILEANPWPPPLGSLDVTIIAPGIEFSPHPQPQYTLGLRSASLNGTCKLQCELGGILLSGLMNGVLVVISNGYQQDVSPEPPGQ